MKKAILTAAGAAALCAALIAAATYLFLPEPGPQFSPGKVADAATFEDILGYDGFYVTEKTMIFPPETVYYAEKGRKTFPIAKSWGMREDYAVDVDGDGKNELICNVVYGDGGMDTVIYRREGKEILYGFAKKMLDEPYDDFGTGSVMCSYLPEENLVEIQYWVEAEEQFLSKKYPVEFDLIPQWEDAQTLFDDEN